MKVTAIVRNGKRSRDSTGVRARRLSRQERVGLMRYGTGLTEETIHGLVDHCLVSRTPSKSARLAILRTPGGISLQVQLLLRKRKKPTADRVCVGLTRGDDVSLGF